MRRITKKSKEGLTRERSEEIEHQLLLIDVAGKLRRHYNKREPFARPKKGWNEVDAVQFFIRDLFEWETEKMRRVVVQCIDWLKGIHDVKLTKEEAAGVVSKLSLGGSANEP